MSLDTTDVHGRFDLHQPGDVRLFHFADVLRSVRRRSMISGIIDPVCSRSPTASRALTSCAGR